MYAKRESSKLIGSATPDLAIAAASVLTALEAGISEKSADEVLDVVIEGLSVGAALLVLGDVVSAVPLAGAVGAVEFDSS